MYRISEEIAHKIMRNAKAPSIGPLDITQKDPFQPLDTKSIGYIDPYCCIGLDFDYILEVPYPYINSHLPPLNTLNGYWLYKRGELQQPDEPFMIPRYLVDPNTDNIEEQIDTRECAVVLPTEVDKLTCKSILTFEQLIKLEPSILDCLKEKIL